MRCIREGRGLDNDSCGRRRELLGRIKCLQCSSRAYELHVMNYDQLKSESTNN